MFFSLSLLLGQLLLFYSQVIFNLLNNAIKFSEEQGEKVGGTINIRTDNIDSQIHVSIKDTDTGKHSKIMPMLFEKLYQNLINELD